MTCEKCPECEGCEHCPMLPAKAAPEPSLEQMKLAIEAHLQERGAKVGCWGGDESIRNIYYELPERYRAIVSEAAPESEDEAFERWWTSTHPTYLYNVRDEAKAAWNARARLDAERGR